MTLAGFCLLSPHNHVGCLLMTSAVCLFVGAYAPVYAGLVVSTSLLHANLTHNSLTILHTVPLPLLLSLKLAIMTTHYLSKYSSSCIVSQCPGCISASAALHPLEFTVFGTFVNLLATLERPPSMASFVQEVSHATASYRVICSQNERLFKCHAAPFTGIS